MSAQNPEPIGYWFCPLFCFDSSCESIELAEDTRIGKLEHLPDAIKDYLRERIHLLVMNHETARWALWLQHSEKIGSMSLPDLPDIVHDKIENLFTDLVTALRLCHEGMVTPSEIVFVSSRPSESGIVSLSFPSYISKPPESLPFVSNYVLKDSDISMVNGLVEEIRRLKTKAVSVAVRRFNLSYSDDFEDRIIDHMIAFEFLYLGHDQELKYRLALRIAFLLGKDCKGEREYIFNRMMKAYKLRSDIVHGNKQVDVGKLMVIVPETEEYLRQSIRRFLLLLSQGYSLKEIREKLLDENILKNGKLLALRE